MVDLPYAFSRCEAVAELAVIVLVMLISRSIDSPFGSDSASFVVRLSQIRPSIRPFSLYNLHGDGVEHPDKTLLLKGIGRQKMVHLIEETLLFALLALNIDLDGKFFCKIM